MDQPDDSSLMTSLIRREKYGAVKYRPGNDENFIRAVRDQSVRAFDFFRRYTENLNESEATDVMLVSAGELFSAASAHGMNIEDARLLNNRLGVFVERIKTWYSHIYRQIPPAASLSQTTADAGAAPTLLTNDTPANSSSSANHAVNSQGQALQNVESDLRTAEADRLEALMIIDLSNARQDLFLGLEDPVVELENLDHLREGNADGTAAHQQYLQHKNITDAWHNQVELEGTPEEHRFYSGQSHRKTLKRQLYPQTTRPTAQPNTSGAATSLQNTLLDRQNNTISQAGSLSIPVPSNPASATNEAALPESARQHASTVATETASSSRARPLSSPRQMLSRTAIIRGPTMSFEQAMQMRIEVLDRRISQLQAGQMPVPSGSSQYSMPNPAPAVGRLNMDILQVIVQHVEFETRLALLRSCKTLASTSGPCVAVIDVAKIASGVISTPMVLISERVQGKDGKLMDSFHYAPYSEGVDHATILVIVDNLVDHKRKQVREQSKFTNDTFAKVWNAALLCKGISQLEVQNTAYFWPGLITSTLLQDFKKLKVLRIRKCPFFSLKDLQIATDFPKSILNMNQDDLPFAVDFDFEFPILHEDFHNTGFRTTDTSYFQVYLPHLLRSHESRVIGNGRVRDALLWLTHCPRREAEALLKLFHETAWEGTALFKIQENAAVDRSRRWANKPLSHTSPDLCKDVYDAIQFGVTKHKAQIKRMEVFEQKLSISETNVASFERMNQHELSASTIDVAKQMSTTLKTFLKDAEYATNFDNSWVNAVRQASYKVIGCDEITINLQKFSAPQIKELLLLSDGNQTYKAQVDPMIDLIIACNAHLRPGLNLQWDSRFNSKQPVSTPKAFQMELCSDSCETEHYGNSFADSNFKSGRGSGSFKCGSCRQFNMLDELDDRENAYKTIHAAVTGIDAFVEQGLSIMRSQLPNNGMMLEKDRATLKSIQPSPNEEPGHSSHYSTIYEDSDGSDTEDFSAPNVVAERPRYNPEAFLSFALIISKVAVMGVK